MIENRTDETIEVFLENPSGERSFILDLGPDSSTQLPTHCAAATYVALTEDGVEVDRRPGTGECNLDTWVIDPN